jgi:hypothetical protein
MGFITGGFITGGIIIYIFILYIMSSRHSSSSNSSKKRSSGTRSIPMPPPLPQPQPSFKMSTIGKKTMVGYDKKGNKIQVTSSGPKFVYDETGNLIRVIHNGPTITLGSNNKINWLIDLSTEKIYTELANGRLDLTRQEIRAIEESNDRILGRNQSKTRGGKRRRNKTRKQRRSRRSRRSRKT